MLHVIIDTSIYRKDPKRTTLAFNALTRLCEVARISICAHGAKLLLFACS
jgi:hypothetical protein